MNATQALHDAGQSLWLDQITRNLVTKGGLDRYIRDFSVTGLTSNPSIFDKAFRNGDYAQGISNGRSRGEGGESLFFELAIQDLVNAAKSFRPIFERTSGVDGWVSLEVSPLLTHDAAKTLVAAKALTMQAAQPNLFIKIPGTKEGLVAIEEAIYSGIPINVTLLFSREQYVAAATAYMRGLERRVLAGLSPQVASVASVFISRWDVAVSERIPSELRNELGIAIGKRTYKAYRDLLNSARWLRLANLGARPQRLLWASTGTKDPKASDLLYVTSLAAPLTINTMPEGTLKALESHGDPNIVLLAVDGGEAEAVLARFAEAGIDVMTLADSLQGEGAQSFVRSWNALISGIDVPEREQLSPQKSPSRVRGQPEQSGERP